jgi:hypothetical protein
MEGLAGMMVGVWVGLVVLVIAWIAMPFAIFGTKPILRMVLAELKENNKLLRELKERPRATTTALPADGASKVAP